MSNQILKNIKPEEVLNLANLVQIMPGQIVSKTLVQNEAVSMTLFAFSKGEEISTHQSDGDAMVTILEGTGRLTVDGKDYVVHQGDTLVMPAQKPHAVFGEEDFKMLLVVVF